MKHQIFALCAACIAFSVQAAEPLQCKQQTIEKSVTIQGGCVPESKDGAEVARICNFFWGKYQVVKDVRFEFK
jgi:hypothetical protein